ncbi:GNAT family N-acetyltransferase [Deinococcus taeanensis]|uniref:GNAT family N-acetyltransferase n=1 Tax=Deinococcus taeanensis TaxID=2737050 RepID=UPI001CDB96B6|nr:GNAT family N-acetyltransferase [Deinococcus taeanensis]UBV43440.1 GNAT family N-acetyltransferase [Deinococcus taeanensis]
MQSLTFTSGDLNAAAAVVRASARHLQAQGRTLWTPESVTPERLARHYPAPTWQVAWRGAGPVGAYALLPSDPPFWPDDPAHEALYLHKLAVHPDAQGQGLGRTLLAHAVDLTRAAERPWLKLDTAVTRPALQRLYEDFGFERVGERDVFDFRVVLYRYPVLAVPCRSR